MGDGWASIQTYLMPCPCFFKEREAEGEGHRRQKGREAAASTEEDRALDNGYYGTWECQTILQPLYMGHFLTALATGPAADAQ